ncbi:MAG: leucine-rich repeat domain-containing protein [Candidatus Sigynarchaeota archaeon]
MNQKDIDALRVLNCLHLLSPDHVRVRGGRDMRVIRVDLGARPKGRTREDPFGGGRYAIDHLNEAIGDLDCLEFLRLDCNYLTDLPYTMKNLKSLHDLDLQSNEFHHIPDVICEIVNLVSLNLSGNHITKINNRIFTLTSLKKLNLGGNEISELDPSIHHLTNLRELYLNGNNLTSLPESIGELKNLTRLCLSNNRLARVPESISKLRNLERLELDGNPLEELPKSFAKLQNLRQVDLLHTKITTFHDYLRIMPKLRYLHADFNLETSKVPIESSEYSYDVPDEESQIIEYDPNVFDGEPIIKGTHIRAASIYELIGADVPIEEIIGLYPSLTRDIIKRIVEEMSR